MFKYFCILTLLLLYNGYNLLYSNNIIDSLLNKLENCEEKNKADIYNSLAYCYRDSSGNTAMYYAEKTIEYSKKYNDQKTLVNGYISLGTEYLNNAEYINALNYFMLAEQCSDKNDLLQQHSITNKLGILYRLLEEFDLSEEYHIKALNYAKKINNSDFIIESSLNIGNLFVSLNEAEKGIHYYRSAIEESKRTKGFCEYTPIIYNNIGHVYVMKKEYEKSFRAFQTSYKYFDSLRNDKGLATSLNNMAEAMIRLKKFEEAEFYIQKADSIHKLNNYNNSKANLYYTAYELYYESKNYEQALTFLTKYHELKDSIHTVELDIIIKDLKTQYEVDKLKIETELKDNKIQLQRKINLFLIVIILIVGNLSIWLAITIKQKNKLNKLLKTTNEEISNTHKEITDNLNYARKIQSACIEKGMNSISFDFFVIDLPKNIVGGDFYFMKKADNKTFIALADSTGHGISGGFLSVLGIQYLQAAIKQHFKLDDILNDLNNRFYNSITSSDALMGESLCISIICIEKDLVSYAGSKHKIWKYNSLKRDLEEYTTDKHVLGISSHSEFSVNTFSISRNDCIFLSSDGYPDQFGANGKGKLKYKKLREIFMQASKTDMTSAKTYLINYLTEWKANEEQTDDISVIGIKI
jgi:serine phosphatase RsbU (regulator of sigma subunit)